jgi:hypothetical protein
MAEYYAVLKKAVSGLELGSAEARRAVYDKARNALIGQLKAIDPPLPAAEISRQRLELEEAIRRVERENAGEVPGARYQRRTDNEPAPSTVPEPMPPAAEEGNPSPQDIFRRAIQDAQGRGAAPSPPVERAPMRAADQYGQRAEPRVGQEAPPLSRPVYRADPRQDEDEPRLAPDYEDDWQPRAGGARPPPEPEPYAERRDRPRNAPRKRQAYVDEGDEELLERAPRRSRLPAILLVVLIVGMVVGLGALAWSQRTVIADLVAGFDGPPAGEAASPAVATAPTEDPSNKSEDRLTGGANGDSSVRVIGQSETGGAASSETTAAPDPIADAIAGNTDASGDALVTQKAVLYEEPLDAATAAAGVTAINAVVTWRFVEDGTNGPEIEANLEIPDRSMKIRLVIRRNSDPSLPASHLVETVIDTPPDFPGQGIRSVPRMVLKANEDERGQPLIGAAAKVADGFFWIALSAAEADVAQNERLLRDRLWIDLPMVYESGQRAILTFEKGTPGERVFDKAFAAWSTG